MVVSGITRFYFNGVNQFSLGSSDLIDVSGVVSKNSTHVKLSKKIGNRFVDMYWRYIGDDFKLTLCWNLLSSVTLKLPVTVFKKFENSTFYFDDVRFDWNDAVRNGYVITYDQVLNSVSIPVARTGCLDPLVTTSTANQAAGANHNMAFFAVDRWWVALKGADSGATSDVRYYSAPMSSTVFNTGRRNWRADSSPGDYVSYFFNGTHSVGVFHNNDKGDRWVTNSSKPASNGSLSNWIRADFNIGQYANNGNMTVARDNLGFTHVYFTKTNKLYKNSLQVDSGTFSAVNNTAVFLNSTNHMLTRPILFNMSSNRMMIVAGDSSVLKYRMWYPSNSSYGAITTISGTLSTAAQFACIDLALGTKLGCATIEGGVVKYYVWDGSSVGSATNVAWPGAIGYYSVAISKASGDDRVIIYRISSSSGPIKYNQTNASGIWSFSGDISGTTGQTSMDTLSSVRRANSTSHSAIVWRNSTVTVNVHFIIKLMDSGVVNLVSISDTITTTITSLTSAFIGFRLISDTITSNPVIVALQNLFRSISDTHTTSDSIDRLLVLFRAVTDSSTFTDTPTRLLVLYRSITDSFTTTDNIVKGFFTGLSDTITTTVNLSIFADMFRGTSETQVFSDSIGNMQQIFVSLIDSITTSFNLDRLQNLFRNITGDIITITDEITGTFTPGFGQFFRSLSDTIAFADDIARKAILQRLIDDTQVMIDDIQRQLNLFRSMSENIIPSDVLTCAISFDPFDCTKKFIEITLNELIIWNTEFTVVAKLFTEDGATEILILFILFSLTSLFLIRRRYKAKDVGNY